MLKIQKGSGGGLAAKLSENGDFYIVETSFYKAQGNLRNKLARRLSKAAGALNNKNVKRVERTGNERVVIINDFFINLNLWD